MQQSPAERLCVPSQAVVSSVDPGGLAEAAGFKVGDVIISMVSPLATVADELAPEVLKPLEPGMVCTVTVRRDVIAPTVTEQALLPLLASLRPLGPGLQDAYLWVRRRWLSGGHM